MNSCVTAPEEEILNALEENNLQLFSDIINDDGFDINHEFPEKEFSTLLHLCVANGQVEFVREILKNASVNADKPHKVLQKTPLHVAVEAGNLALVKLLFRQADVNAKMGNGNTALHLAAVRSAANWIIDDNPMKLSKQGEFLLITRLLLSVPGIIVDCKNNIGVTPLHFAVDKGTESVAKELINRGACVTIEVDGDTIEELIEEKMPTLTEGLVLNRQDNDSIENKLFHILYYEVYDAGRFQEAWNKAEEGNNNIINVNADNGTYTFLQYCADQGHHELVKFLLKKGASPNQMSKNYLIPPLVLAGHHGYYKVLKAFKESSMPVNYAAKDKIKDENVLHKIIKGESRSSVNVDFRDYDQCLDLLLDDSFRPLILPAVNAQDQMGNTPLHMAAQLGKESYVRKLLRCEANIGIKNNRMETPITFITPCVMEDFLDECLEDYGLITDDNFQLTFKYSFLGPPLSQQEGHLLDPDDTLDEGYLEIKDKSVTAPDGQNAVLDDLPEAEPLWYMSQSMDHRPLLAHPVITSFLCLKWRRIRPYYYANLIIYLLFVACLTAYLLMLDKTNASTSGLRVTTLILASFLTLREGFQALVSPRRYFFNLENLLEIIMLAISIHLTHRTPPLDQLHKNLAAAAVLLSWTEMFLMFGRHPKLSTFIKMFSTVSVNFMTFLCWYIVIILAFGLAFFFILGGGDNDYFKDPEKSLLKTIVMSLTGELEFADIDFGQEFTLYAKLVFLLYIFFIMLVLVNLLNGLAVSDISVIQKEAQLLSYVSRVELIAFIESMLLGDPFHFLTNWPPFDWGRKLPPCDCFRSIYSLGPIRWTMTKLMGTTLLFSDRLKNKKAVFLPNQSKREQSSLPGPDGGRKASQNLVLDDTVIESAKCLLLKRKENRELTALSGKLKQIEKSMLLMNKQQNLLIEMVRNISAK